MQKHSEEVNKDLEETTKNIEEVEKLVEERVSNFPAASNKVVQNFDNAWGNHVVY